MVYIKYVFLALLHPIPLCFKDKDCESPHLYRCASVMCAGSPFMILLVWPQNYIVYQHMIIPQFSLFWWMYSLVCLGGIKLELSLTLGDKFTVYNHHVGKEQCFLTDVPLQVKKGWATFSLKLKSNDTCWVAEEHLTAAELCWRSCRWNLGHIETEVACSLLNFEFLGEIGYALLIRRRLSWRNISKTRPKKSTKGTREGIRKFK